MLEVRSPVQNGVKWATIASWNPAIFGGQQWPAEIQLFWWTKIASWNPAFFGGQQLSAGIHCQLFLDRDSLVS